MSANSTQQTIVVFVGEVNQYNLLHLLTQQYVCLRVFADLHICVCYIYMIKELIGFADRFVVKHKESRDSSARTDPDKSSSTCKLCMVQEGEKRNMMERLKW